MDVNSMPFVSYRFCDANLHPASTKKREGAIDTDSNSIYLCIASPLNTGLYLQNFSPSTPVCNKYA